MIVAPGSADWQYVELQYAGYTAGAQGCLSRRAATSGSRPVAGDDPTQVAQRTGDTDDVRLAVASIGDMPFESGEFGVVVALDTSMYAAPCARSRVLSLTTAWSW